MKIAFIGGGNMASALIGGLLKRSASPADLYVVETSDAARDGLRARFGVRTGAAPDATLAQYDAIVLAVKPQSLAEVARTLGAHLGGQLVISIAAGMRAADLARMLGGYARIVRAMPNTPALIGMGVTGLVALDGVDAAGRTLATAVLEAVGEVVWCDNEAEIDVVTAVSGSGPAYVFYFIEALERAGRELGLSAERAHALALATFTGAAQLAAQSDDPIAVLRERVTSKGGTTAAALASFGESDIGSRIVKGVRAAQARAVQMGDELGQG